jgi:glycosyltransferase involved in cell wall biosynthesis
MESPKPRVVIDARMVGPVGHGIGNYVLQLAEALAKRELAYEPCYLLHHSCPPDSLLRSLPHAETAIPFLHPREIWALANEIAQLEPALYHSPSFASLARYPCPHVQTVHDLNHLRFGGWKEKTYYRLLLLPSLRKAKAVLSVSRSSAEELSAWLRSHGCNRELAVASNSILPFPLPERPMAALERFGLRPDAYFFALSNPKPHKNLAFLEEAYAAARAEMPELPPLVLSVPGGIGGGIVHTGPLADLEIGALLQNARAFFFPSLYEGFGRPPLEAALHGTVPWVSDLPVHREVLAGVQEARFLPLHQLEAWKKAFLESARKEERVGKASRDWIAVTYSAEKLASVMDSVYLRALGI